MDFGIVRLWSMLLDYFLYCMLVVFTEVSEGWCSW